MAERPPFERAFERSGEALRRAMDANLRYYEGLQQLTAEYVKALASVLGELRLPLDLGTLDLARGRERTRTHQAEVVRTEPSTTAALVLEGEAGAEARAAFVIDNDLPREVVAPVRSSLERDVTPVRTEPDVVTLGPGERALVQIVAEIGENLGIGESYRGEVSVPDLSQTRVPIVVRRVEPRTDPAP